jgi:hypothetical protein
MISIAIGPMSVPLEKASDMWISQMVAESQKHGGDLCIRISVSLPSVNLSLATPGCGGQGGGGTRRPNAAEQQIFDAWRRRGLDQGRVTSGELRAFLNELARLV